MKKICLILILFIPFQFIYCQNFSFDFHAGFGTYQLQALKDFQTNMKEFYSPLSIEETDHFPDYFNYSSSIEYWYNNKNSIGLNGAFYTTGGRNHIKDYSGEYKLEMSMDGYRIGIQDRNIISEFNKIKIYVCIRGGLLISGFKMNEYIKINNVDSTSTGYKFRSKTFFGEPSLGIRYFLGTRMSLDFCAGYQIDTNGKLHLKKNRDITLNNPAEKTVFVNWSGIRILLGLSFDLF